MLFHPTPDTENNENHRNNSGGVLWSAITPFVRKLDLDGKCRGIWMFRTYLGTPKDVQMRLFGGEGGKGVSLRNW